MKRIIFTATFILMAAAGLSSCNNPSELPPLDSNYDTSFIMPEPTDLSASERSEVDKIREEYREAMDKLK